MQYTIENIRLGSRQGYYTHYIKVRKPNGKCLMSGRVWSAITRYLKSNGYICADAGLDREHDAIEYHKPGTWTADGDYVKPDPPESIGSELALAVTLETGHVMDAVDYDNVRR